MLLTARETAERLGIKIETLYAYVSRGLLKSVELENSRERHYDVADVERFRTERAGMRGIRPPPEALMPVIGSSICLIENHRIYYRGHDALHLAETASLEQVAAILWEDKTVSPPGPPPAEPARFRVPGEALTGIIERCQKRLAELAVADHASLDLTRAGVIRTGWLILGELAAAVGGDDPSPRPVHERLGAAWALSAAGADLVRRCLVLLADHELNTSTFVARCVASTGATPHATVSGALAALSGRRHGGASARAEALLQELDDATDPMPAMAARLARGDDLPGLGHPLYPRGDPRAPAIIAALCAALPEAGARAATTAQSATALTGQFPNVDFALGAVSVAIGLPRGAALGIFLVARTVGWLAHAMEQYESGVLIRPRARYIGTGPSALAG